ncbi:NifB/NifX family molybdenum-iron cluster-binding protein, partial [Desulfofundulus sp.]|uniref:NifB/NifX family molybdenum-iron cluster-binding protein n=1 Tax=Desulfofundulus sp. TaxID=2282750 RepID=UPI003C737FFC
MKVALARWSNRISPLFDVAQEALVVEISRGQIISRKHVRLDDSGWPPRIEQLARLGVKVLICGAISNFLLHQV